MASNRRLSFYAAVFGQETTVRDIARKYGDKRRYRESIRPGAFTGFLQGNGEVLGTVDHREDMAFARRTTGELIVQQDNHGLFCSTFVPVSDLGDQILRDVDAGKLRGASVRMPYDGMVEDWSGTDSDPLCEIIQSGIADVCITAFPAYQGAGVMRTDNDRMIADYLNGLRLSKSKLNLLKNK